MTREETATQLAVEMIRKSGIREWDTTNPQNAETAARMAMIAYDMAELIWNGPDEEPGNDMTNYQKLTTGTVFQIKNSGGDAAITLASLANGNGTSAGARQAVTLDFGSNWARQVRMDTEYELAATPTAGAVINHYGSFSNSTGAGAGNTSGTDAAYTGYSNNIDAAAKHLVYLGSHVCTSQATATVQKSYATAVFTPSARYMNLVVDNRSGAAFHSTDTNQVIRFTFIDDPTVTV